MKQWCIVTHQYTTLQDTEKTLPILNRPTLWHITFLYKDNDKQFFGGRGMGITF